MRLSAVTALVWAAATLAACDSSSGITSCPDTGLVTVADSVVGTGQAATRFSSVNVRYKGRLASDGTVFDSTASNPVRFSLGQVVTGFRQGIGGRTATDAAPAIAPMRIGGQRRIFIPANYGYGAFPPTEAIPQCADLVFDVELVDL